MSALPVNDENGGATTPDPRELLAQVLSGGPEAAAQMVAQMGPAIVPEDLNETLNELLGAARVCASAARSAADTREQRELGAAALTFAQSWVIMHPALVAPQGVPAELLNQQQEGGTTGRPPQPTARRDGQVKG